MAKEPMDEYLKKLEKAIQTDDKRGKGIIPESAPNDSSTIRDLRKRLKGVYADLHKARTEATVLRQENRDLRADAALAVAPELVELERRRNAMSLYDTFEDLGFKRKHADLYLVTADLSKEVSYAQIAQWAKDYDVPGWERLPEWQDDYAEATSEMIYPEDLQEEVVNDD